MVDLSANCAGIRSPNPFWLASGPPTNSGAQIQRAFDAGWGGAVWKTLGVPIQNVSSRFGSLGGGRALRAGGAGVDPLAPNPLGFNNIELITDRPLEQSFREIAETKRKYPKHALVVSLMFESRDEWRDAIARAVEAGADGLELNFGCPHGMCERGMGSVVGQNPAVNAEITSWAVEFSRVPVLVKLTPNVADILPHGLAAKRGGAHGVSLINTVKSLMGVDLDTWSVLPSVAGRGTNGGYCGAAVKPIALHMVGQLARAKDFGLPISGIGGISTWRDAVEFLLLGASTVQLCTEVMLRGFRVIDDLLDGLGAYLRERGASRLDELVGKAVPSFVDWGDLDLNFESVARIDPAQCIGCQRCVVACHDGAHQCIHAPTGGSSRVPVVDEAECVGCNLCQIVCPVPGCITMTTVDNGHAQASWNEHLARGAPLRPKKGSH